MIRRDIQTVTPREVFDRYRRGEPVELIDVRTPGEYGEVHAEMARLVPLGFLDPQRFLALRNADGQAPLYFICRSGSRGRKACERFVAAGFSNVADVEGGTEAWVREGLPVVRGAKGVSLERQVRIAAGSLVLLGVALGVLVHPYLLGLAALVGGGLVFAGVTDTCAMGMLLSKMPWNKTDAGPRHACPTGRRMAGTT